MYRTDKYSDLFDDTIGIVILDCRDMTETLLKVLLNPNVTTATKKYREKESHIDHETTLLSRYLGNDSCLVLSQLKTRSNTKCNLKCFNVILNVWDCTWEKRLYLKTKQGTMYPFTFLANLLQISLLALQPRFSVIFTSSNTVSWLETTKWVL